MHRILARIGTAMLGMMLAVTAEGSPLPITINTSSVAGTQAVLAFDFIDGGTPGNTLTISGFTTDGVLGVGTSQGDVTGALPGTLVFGDSSFFNEYLQAIVLGNTLGFTVDSSGNSADPAGTPDAFALYFLDAGETASLFATSDPFGTNALIAYSVGASNPLEVFASDAVSVRVGSLAVAEPSTHALLATALMAAIALARRRSGYLPAKTLEAA
jgi:hypothetical protein